MKNLIRKFKYKEACESKGFILSILFLGIICISLTSSQCRLNQSYNDRVGYLHSIGSSNYSFENILIKPKTIVNLDEEINVQISLNEEAKKNEEERVAKIEDEKKAEKERIVKLEEEKELETQRQEYQELLALEEAANEQQETEDAPAAQEEESSQNDLSSDGEEQDNAPIVPVAVIEPKTCQDYGYETTFDAAYQKAFNAGGTINAAGWGAMESYPEENLECFGGYYYLEYEDQFNDANWIWV